MGSQVEMTLRESGLFTGHCLKSGVIGCFVFSFRGAKEEHGELPMMCYATASFKVW
ncbi:hypothetical protein [Bartonella tribocorum]|uniref:hypothetical protein n=1 Tax=Bartonella tribocorum TaxID=85701 RepID=UPI0015D53D5C|nr:hypothetical protein [Bartonella tribocorum]